MKIILSGGGTAGSVTPLLALAERLSDHDLLFVGTRAGVERTIVEKRLPYYALPAGKLRRYFDWHNITDILVIGWAFIRSLGFMLRQRPDVVVTAGSFVSVPLVWAAWCCGVRTVVHQQDLQVGLAIRLMQPFATVLTKSFIDIPLHGAEVIGNPVRDLTPTTSGIVLDKKYPTILIFGGGTGAQAINENVSIQLCEFANVIHITGKGKTGPAIQHKRYQVFELLEAEMKEALAKADLVIARAGLSTLSELAVLAKPAIIIPMPNTHQEHNAAFLDKHNAAFILRQTQITPESLAQDCKMLLEQPDHLAHFAHNINQLMPTTAAHQLTQRITQLSDSSAI